MPAATMAEHLREGEGEGEGEGGSLRGHLARDKLNSPSNSPFAISLKRAALPPPPLPPLPPPLLHALL